VARSVLRGQDLRQRNPVTRPYVRLTGGFVYLTAIIDWYSRKVLAWRVSNTLDSDFCVACLESALYTYGASEIFNTDQGVQFTAADFIKVLKEQNIKISMDGRGRALDNIFVERLWRSVKYEDVYLKSYDSVTKLIAELTDYFIFYNAKRMHQSLGYRTPDAVYQSGLGGGARIVDKFSAEKYCLMDTRTSPSDQPELFGT
jgi:putative transposase